MVRPVSPARFRLFPLALAAAGWPLAGLAGQGVPAAPVPIQIQEVRGNVVDGGTGALVEGAMVLLLDAEGRRAGGVLSGTSGFFRVYAPTPGRYRLRVDRIGYASTDTDLFEVAPGAVVQRRVVAAVEPVALAQLDVSAAARCEVRPEGVATATVWEEARKALAAATWTAERGLYRFTWTRFERRMDAEGRRVLSEVSSFQRQFVIQPFVAAEPERLAERGFVERLPNGGANYYAPDAAVLLSDAFLDTHCFRLDPRAPSDSTRIALRSEPLGGRTAPEVEGVLLLERVTARLKSLQYRYVNHPLGLPDNDGGGEVTFAELPNGTWIVNHWRIRMPEILEERDGQQRFRRFVITGYRDSGGTVQQVATASGTVVLDEVRAGIGGVVVDSAGRPVAGAFVWLAGSPAADTTDTNGTFGFPALGAGTWTVVTTAWPLDAAGLTTQQEAEVGDKGMRTVRVQIPPLRDAALARCQGTNARSVESILVGRVVDADGTPAAGAAVRVSWTAVARNQATGRMGLVLRTDERGTFVQCGVPPTELDVEAGLGPRVTPAVAVPPAGATGVRAAHLVLP